MPEFDGETPRAAGISVVENTRRFYDADAGVYDELRWKSPAGQYNNHTQIDIVRSLLPAAVGRAVEVGSGTGRFSTILNDRASSLTLVDVATAMLRKASERASGAYPVSGDACHLPLADESVDCLMCLNVLSHIEAYQNVLCEFGRVLRPDGTALVNFNNLTSLYFVPGSVVNWRKRSFRAEVYSHWVSWAEFRNSLESAHLCLVSARGHLHSPAWTPRAMTGLLRGVDRWMRNRFWLSPLPFLLVVKAKGRRSAR